QQYNDTMPPAGISSRQPQPTAPRLTAPVQPATAPPAVKLERIVALPPREIEGTIVRDDKTPQANVRVKLVSAESKGVEQTVTADGTGQFRARLTSGGWLVYVQQADGKLDFVRKIDVRDDQPQQYTLVSR
ncbi:MAG TPA: carboxypeptidase-like regulatory domain-containing protein, partial [Gemmataceae bacterium]|nr:carboxypeptidase-like regulatory domain-containing protein [Gemmataceae bacterium]